MESSNGLLEGVGKRVAQQRYFHVSLLPQLNSGIPEQILEASAVASVRAAVDYNVVRIDHADDSIALLSYPDFFDEACPSLSRSWKVNAKEQRATLRHYTDSLNPPILHRKELLIGDAHPCRQAFERLTAELEAIGCFDD